MDKLFCVGHCRSGQKTLCRIAEILGYKNIVFNPPTYTQLDDADFSAGTGCSMYYSYLAIKYPAAKFVFQTRSIEGWLQSCKKILDSNSFDLNRFSKEEYKNAAIRNRSYRWWSLGYNEQKMRSAYWSHLRNVKELFSCLKKTLLFIDIPSNPSASINKLIQYMGYDPNQWTSLIDNPPKIDFVEL